MSEYKQTDRLLAQITNSIRSARTRIMRRMGLTHDGERDLFAVFGYPRSIDIDAFYERYRRGGIEQRIIRAFPKATWATPPKVTDDANTDKETEFEGALEDLDRKFSIWHMLERADRLSAIGRYGVLLMGFADGKHPREPLEKGDHPLIYLRPFSERSIDIAHLDNDPKSPRYGLPEEYNLHTTGLNETKQQAMTVHHSRVLHITEFPEEDDIYGTPRLEAVYNRLLDLEKVSGGSAEAFWLNANAALALVANADSEMSESDIESMKNQADEFQHQLRRIFALQGVDVKQLQVQIADPSSHVDALFSMLAGAIGMPKRILIGNEQGELASTSDDDQWSADIDSRRSNYAAPRIVRPFVDLMIETGNLPSPKGGDYDAAWDEQDTLPEDKKAEIADRKASALSKYASNPIAETIVPPREFREQILGLDPEPDGGFPEEVEPDDEGDIDADTGEEDGG